MTVEAWGDTWPTSPSPGGGCDGETVGGGGDAAGGSVVVGGGSVGGGGDGEPRNPDWNILPRNNGRRPLKAAAGGVLLVGVVCAFEAHAAMTTQMMAPYAMYLHIAVILGFCPRRRSTHAGVHPSDI